jgi:hypothetical protein
MDDDTERGLIGKGSHHIINTMFLRHNGVLVKRDMITPSGRLTARRKRHTTLEITNIRIKINLLFNGFSAWDKTARHLIANITHLAYKE